MKITFPPAFMRSPRLTRYRTHIAVGAGTAMVAGLLFATGPDAVPEATTEKAWTITVVAASPAWMQPAFATYGRFEARRLSTLTSDLIVRIAEVDVNEGDEVAEGDVLVRLEAGDLERRVREAQAGLDMARSALASTESEMALASRTREDYAALHEAAQSKLQRHRELLDRKLISQVLFDEVASQAAEASIRNQTQLRLIDDLPNRLAQSEAGVMRAAAMLEQTRTDLDETLIRAPFSGPVLSVTAAPGEMNAPGTPLVEVSSRGSFELRLEIPDRYAGRLEQSLLQKQAVVATSPDSTRFVLNRLGRHVREGQGGIDAFFVAENPVGSDALIGRVIEAQVLLPAEADLLALPPESLYENSRIYQVIDQRLSALPVERVGENTIAGQYRLLVRGRNVPRGASILTTQLPQAVTGLLVAPIEAATPDGALDTSVANIPTTVELSEARLAMGTLMI